MCIATILSYVHVSSLLASPLTQPISTWWYQVNVRATESYFFSCVRKDIRCLFCIKFFFCLFARFKVCFGFHVHTATKQHRSKNQITRRWKRKLRSKEKKKRRTKQKPDANAVQSMVVENKKKWNQLEVRRLFAHCKWLNGLLARLFAFDLRTISMEVNPSNSNEAFGPNSLARGSPNLATQTLHWIFDEPSRSEPRTNWTNKNNHRSETACLQCQMA